MNLPIPGRPRPHRATHVATVPLLLMLAGCAQPGAPTAAVPCGSDPAARHVVVDIRYAADGLPSASPDACEVRRGTTVTWIGPEGNPAGFELVFHGVSPSPAAPRGPWPSRPGQGRQRVEARMDGAPGHYKYDIRANGRMRDPAIIIR